MSTTRILHARSSGAGIALTAVVVAVAGLVVLALLTRSDARQLATTGETNAMGVPVVVTPGEGSGVAAAGGVEVTEANWALGEVPLDVAVLPTWTLTNTSDQTVTLGEPHAEVVEGCCPGPITLETAQLAPGEATTMTFDLAMHEGMDGWHHLDVHVPVAGSDGAPSADSDVLTVNVTGHFGDRSA